MNVHANPISMRNTTGATPDRKTVMNKKSVITVTAALVVTLTIVGLAGCESGKQYGPSVEVASPTGCFKSAGRYFDPKTHQCVQVTDQHQALVLNAYRYVNQLAEKDAGVTEYSIYPKKFLTLDEAEVLWSDLKDHGAKMIVLGGTLPDDRIYDPEETWDLKWQQEHNNQPRIWGGPGATSPCGWWKRDDAPSDTVQGMFVEGMKTLEKERPRPQLRKAVLEDGDCRIRDFEIFADAKVMRDWVNRHLDEIEGTQPIVDFLDKNMPELGPTQATKEGA